MIHWPNKPAAPNAGIASQLTIGPHWPGVGEPERWVIFACRKSIKQTDNEWV